VRLILGGVAELNERKLEGLGFNGHVGRDEACTKGDVPEEINGEEKEMTRGQSFRPLAMVSSTFYDSLNCRERFL
jgi:hypothetical protein